MNDANALFDAKDLEHAHVKEIARPERDKLLKCQLYPHQVRGVEWMMIREQHPIRAVRGGLVLDDTGLGKTLQTLTLVLSDFINESYSTTLVVCPAHLVRVWDLEIRTHFKEASKVSSVIYHGKSRDVIALERTIEERKGPVVVISSYATVSSIWKKGPIKDLADNVRDPYNSFYNRFWHRIVLDEAHHIRNAKTDQSQSMRHLEATHLWVLSATPVMNTVDDLFALFNFLRAKPFIGSQAKRIWGRFIKRSAFHNMAQLKELLCSLSIRRTKENTLHLPDIRREVMHLNLPSWQRDIYEAIRAYSQTRADKLMNRMNTLHKVKRNMNSQSALDPNEASKLIKHTLSCALTQILRLKQCAVCPILCLQKIRWIKRDFRTESLEQLSSETRAHLLRRLQELRTSPANECPICFDDEADFVSDPCGHNCCQKCWNTILRNTPNCPICRSKVIAVSSIHMEIETLEDCKKSPLDLPVLPPADVVSAKISYILDFLRKQKTLGFQHGKIVITSQWVSLLNLLSKYLIAEGLFVSDKSMITIYGTSNAEDREKLVKKFQENDNVQLLLLSLIAGGEGITITQGACIVMMDRWWNHQSEYQAISRLYRIGQTRDVHVIILHSNNTIEDQIDEIIAYKGMIAECLVSPHVAKVIRAGEWMHRIQICLRSPNENNSQQNDSHTAQKTNENICTKMIDVY